MLIKVTAILKDGRVSVGVPYLPLDSLIYVGYVKEYYPELVGTTYDKPTEFKLPIERVAKDNDWYYASSFALAKVIDVDNRFYNKRFDETFTNEFLNSKVKVIETRKGKYKNIRNNLNIYMTDKISWVINGDLEEIKKCLNHINFIGKKRSQGIGYIKEWIFEETDEDLTYLRAIPNENGLYSCGIRPPAFYIGNIRRVDIPQDERLMCVGAFL